MAGKVQASAHLLDLDVVHIDNFRKLAGGRLQPTLEVGVADQLVAGFDGGWFAFDMGEDVGNLRYIEAHVGFEFGDLIMGVLERHAFIKFDVLLDVKPPREILHADVVDVEVVACGHGANTIKDIFRALGTRQGLHRNIGIWKNVVDRCSCGGHQLVGALKSDGARQPDGQIGEIPVAGAADAYTADLEYTINAGDGIGDLSPDPGGGGVEQGIDGAPRQTPADGNNNSR